MDESSLRFPSGDRDPPRIFRLVREREKKSEFPVNIPGLKRIVIKENFFSYLILFQNFSKGIRNMEILEISSLESYPSVYFD